MPRACIAVMHQPVLGGGGTVASPQTHPQRGVTSGVVFTVVACPLTIARE